MKKTGQLIHKTFNHGKECWKADLPITFTGRSRVRRHFDTKTEAEQFVKSYHQDIRTFGEEPAAWFHLLNPAQRAKFLVTASMMAMWLPSTTSKPDGNSQRHFQRWRPQFPFGPPPTLVQ